MSKSELLAQVLELRPQARLSLICDAIESLPEEYGIDPDLTSAQSDELDRRLDEYLRTPAKGRTWEQVSARVKAKIKEINTNRISTTSTRKRKKSLS